MHIELIRSVGKSPKRYITIDGDLQLESLEEASIERISQLIKEIDSQIENMEKDIRKEFEELFGAPDRSFMTSSLNAQIIHNGKSTSYGKGIRDKNNEMTRLRGILSELQEIEKSKKSRSFLSILWTGVCNLFKSIFICCFKTPDLTNEQLDNCHKTQIIEKTDEEEILSAERNVGMVYHRDELPQAIADKLSDEFYDDLLICDNYVKKHGYKNVKLKLVPREMDKCLSQVSEEARLRPENETVYELFKSSVLKVRGELEKKDIIDVIRTEEMKKYTDKLDIELIENMNSQEIYALKEANIYMMKNKGGYLQFSEVHRIYNDAIKKLKPTKNNYELEGFKDNLEIVRNVVLRDYSYQYQTQISLYKEFNQEVLKEFKKKDDEKVKQNCMDNSDEERSQWMKENLLLTKLYYVNSVLNLDKKNHKEFGDIVSKADNLEKIRKQLAKTEQELVKDRMVLERYPEGKNTDIQRLIEKEGVAGYVKCLAEIINEKENKIKDLNSEISDIDNFYKPLSDAYLEVVTELERVGKTKGKGGKIKLSGVCQPRKRTVSKKSDNQEKQPKSLDSQQGKLINY